MRRMKAPQLVLPPVLDAIVDARKEGATVGGIARRLNLKATVVGDAIKYAEAMGRLTGREVRDARVAYD